MVKVEEAGSWRLAPTVILGDGDGCSNGRGSTRAKGLLSVRDFEHGAETKRYEGVAEP